MSSQHNRGREAASQPTPSPAKLPAISARSAVAPFIAMDVLAEANAIEAGGARVLHMEVGQPATKAPALVRERARQALDDLPLGYTEASGIAPLRERIARHYQEAYGVQVAPERVIVTTGSSGGFMLSFLAAFDAGAKIGLPIPGYPAYMNILEALGLEVVPIDAGASAGFVPQLDAIAAARREHGIAGLLVASPNNPTGTVLSGPELQAISAYCENEGLWFISDEIYHGLTYDKPAPTALSFGDQAIVINSFSKYYSMTGWRVGWMVVPDHLVRAAECLAQSLYISVPALSQHAAVAAFDAVEELEANKAVYRRNRQILAERLAAMGLSGVAPMDGAFYAYVDVSAHTNDSMDFARRLLREKHVAVTPGLDFDRADGQRFVRLSYAGASEAIEEAMQRLGDWL